MSERLQPPTPNDATGPPVLLLVFNRPGPTQRVCEVIRRANPSVLYVGADGPRADRLEDRSRCEATRQVIDRVDWACPVHKRFRDENLGCGRSVSESITWFFDHVEAGVIIEDDCLADVSFFPFAAELLANYRSESSIGAITGNRFVSDQSADGNFFAAKYPSIWGWATWRDRWAQYAFELPGSRFTDFQALRPWLGWPAARFWSARFARVRNHSIDTWDFQWFHVLFRNRWRVLTPTVNLVENIGFDGDGTHTTAKQLGIPKGSISMPTKRCNSTKVADEYDARVRREFFRITAKGSAIRGLGRFKMACSKRWAR